MAQDQDQALGVEKRPRKAAALTIRMTQEVRDLLDDQAREEHRAVSEMAEIWLTAAARGEASYRERIGGEAVSDAIEAMLRFARMVEREIGNPRTFLPARDALQAGWAKLIETALPYTPDTPEGEKYRSARYHVHLVAGLILERFQGLDTETQPELATFAYLRSPRTGGGPGPYVNMLANYGDEPWSQLLVRLRDQTNRGDVRSLKHRLKGAAIPEEFRDLFEKLRQLVEPFEAAWGAYMAPRLEALQRGEALAESVVAVEPAKRP